MATSAVVQLLSLKCVRAQEIDGDEIYLQVGDRILWSTGKLRMHERLADGEQIDEVDFAGGRVHSAAGWTPISDFEAANFTLSVGEGVLIQVKELDLLLGDDLIGQVEIIPADAPHGRIQQALSGEGAEYLLTFDVQA